MIFCPPNMDPEQKLDVFNRKVKTGKEHQNQSSKTNLRSWVKGFSSARYEFVT